MSEPISVLIIEHSEDDALLMMQELQRGGYDPVFERVDTPEGMITAIRKQPWDIAIADYTMSQFSGSAALELLNKSELDLPVIIVSGTIGEEAAVAAIKTGARDFVMKSNMTRLNTIVRRELQEAVLRCQQRRVEETLRQSEEGLAEAQRVARLGNWEWNIPIDEVLWSDETYCLFGMQPQKLRPTYEAFLNCVHPNDREFVQESVRRALNKEQPFDIDYRIVLPSGEVRIVHGSGEVGFDKSGVAVRMFGTVQDITERKLAEERVARAARHWQSTFDAIGDMVAIIDKNHLVVRANRAMKEAFEGSDMLGKKCYELFHGADSPVPNCSVSRTFCSGEAAQAELYEDHLDGRWFDVSSYPIKDDSGEVKQVVHTVRDITERKHAEDALRESQEKLSSIVDNIGLGVALISPKMKILELNNTARDWFPHIKLEDRPLCYCSFNDPPREEPCGCCPTIKTLQDGEVHEAVIQTPRDGKILNFRVAASPVRDAEGKIVGAIEIIEDVTEKLVMEEQLRRASRMESVGRLAGGVAHDFNNLLTAVNGYADIILRSLPADSTLRGNVEQIIEAGTRAAGLTRQLLAFSRRQSLELVVLSVNELVENISKMLSRLIGEDVDLQHIPTMEQTHIKADPGQIEQVLMNLAINARDAMPSGGKLTIETSIVTLDQYYAESHVGVKPGRYVMISVADTGEGMDEDTREHIFEPFFSTKEEGRGTGLGLATVYGIVKQHGGNVWVHSEPGKGTTFKIYLPYVAARVDRVPEKIAESSVPCGTETVLLVEDEYSVRSLVEHILQDLGYRVLSAPEPREAESIFAEQREQIDLLLTDIVLPERNGHALHARLAVVDPTLKVLYMSGYSDNIITRDVTLSTRISLIHKPFTPEILACKVREVLDAGNVPTKCQVGMV